MMNTQELAQRLEDEGCNPALYLIGQPWAVTDIYCLTQVDGTWQVYYTERGQHQPPVFKSSDEGEACDFFYKLIMAMRHDHCVGIFRDETAVHTLQSLLAQNNISSHTDKIPYGGWHDPRYRVFVTGQAIFATKQLLGDIPHKD